MIAEELQIFSKAIGPLYFSQTKPELKCLLAGCQKENLDALSTFAWVAGARINLGGGSECTTYPFLSIAVEGP